MARRQCDQMVHERCGVEKRIGFDSDNDGWFDIDDSTVCTACAALDLYEKEHAKTPLEPGTLLRVIYTREHHH